MHKKFRTCTTRSNANRRSHDRFIFLHVKFKLVHPDDLSIRDCLHIDKLGAVTVFMRAHPELGRRTAEDRRIILARLSLSYSEAIRKLHYGVTVMVLIDAMRTGVGNWGLV